MTGDRTEDEAGGPERLGAGPDRARSEFDDRVVELLSWLLDTETRARIYVHLREHPWSTSEEVADGTGLYPSTVREAVAAMTEEEAVRRRKRQSEGAGNNPYEYTAIPPSDLVRDAVGDLQTELNALCSLDRADGPPAADRVTIEVESPDDENPNH